MNLMWEIKNDDIKKIKDLINTYKSNRFVQHRIEKNITQKNSKITHENFWHAMISCLLTTQQRSGPYSSVTKIINTIPFPLEYKKCHYSNNLLFFVEKTLTDFGGIRRARKISGEVVFNYTWITKDGWIIIENLVNDLNDRQTQVLERKSAELLINYLKGFGPKQSRNLLQMLGLTKYEIPIDSRFIKWLNEFGFPIKLTAGSLNDTNYYNFILDGIHKICDASDIYPCVLDAAIFSSYDPDWPFDNLIW